MGVSDESGHIPTPGLQQQQMSALVAPVSLFLGMICAGSLAVMLLCSLLGVGVLRASSKSESKTFGLGMMHEEVVLPKKEQPSPTTTRSFISIAATTESGDGFEATSGSEAASVSELQPSRPTPPPPHAQVSGTRTSRPPSGHGSCHTTAVRTTPPCVQVATCVDAPKINSTGSTKRNAATKTKLRHHKFSQRCST